MKVAAHSPLIVLATLPLRYPQLLLSPCTTGSAAGCPYFTPSQSGRSAGLSAYDVSPALEKLRYVFANLRLNSTTASLVPLSEGLIFKESMDPTVHYQSDFMPRGRRKAVHGDGVVCQVTLEIDEDNDDNPYTGILRTGSTTAILRLSSTVDPSGQWPEPVGSVQVHSSVCGC